VVEPDDLGKQLTKEYGKELTPYGSWGSTRTRVITVIVILLVFGGIIAWLIIAGHPLPGGIR
jgi:hypothetical protein